MTHSPPRARKLAFALVPFVLVAGAIAGSACDGEDIPPAGATPDGSAPSPTSSTDGATPDPVPTDPPDAGTEEITQGGENLDPDAGAVDPVADAGTLPDGGAVTCNALTVPAQVDTTCASLVPVASGGALVAGSYKLASVRVLATSTFCGKGFVSSKVSGSLDLEQRAAGAFFAQRATLFGAALAPVRRSESVVPAAGNATPLAVTTSCPSGIAASSVPYSSYPITTKAGTVQHLLLRLPFGRGGEALYDYVK